MELLELNLVSTLSGVAAVLFVLFVRLHWPFRFQYISAIFKRNPERSMYWLDCSYRRNRTRSVAALDKSTSEIMAGRYEEAERYIAEGLNICKNDPTIFHQSMVHYLFYNLAALYLHRGRTQEALELAFRVYERDHSLVQVLAIMVCAHARIGDVQGALEAFQVMVKKKINPELKLYCLAELEAAKGNMDLAAQYLRKVLAMRFPAILYLTRQQIEQQLEEWTKASPRVDMLPFK